MRPIDFATIPNFNYHARRASASAQMAGRNGPGISGLMFANRIESQFERPAIRGLAVRYGEVFTHKGQLTAFVAGCFTDTLASGRSVALQLEHDEANVLADSGLRFLDTKEGLCFEYEAPASQSGTLVVSLVASGSRTDVSVGTRNLKTTTRTIRGHDVVLITAADLVEVSLCVDGAVATSHARVVDLASALSLEEEAAAGVLRFTGGCNEMVTASRRVRDTLDKISQPTAPRVYVAGDFPVS